MFGLMTVKQHKKDVDVMMSNFKGIEEAFGIVTDKLHVQAKFITLLVQVNKQSAPTSFASLKKDINFIPDSMIEEELGNG